MENTPGSNKFNLVEEIEKLKKQIVEIETLGYETKYPELITRQYDTGLPPEQYKAWQNLAALKFMRKDLVEMEKKLSDK